MIPDAFQVDEPVDLKVSALAADGSVITDFDGNIFITVDLPQAQYVVPSDGIYTFLEADLWVKLFSKWLVIKEPGEFRVTVEDLLGQVSSSASVVVSENWWWAATWGVIQLVSPQQWTVYEDPSTINIIWTSEVPNTPVHYVLNWTPGEANVSSDANWWFSFYVTDFAPGSNTITVTIKNALGTVLASSDPLAFTVQEVAWSADLLKSYFIQPEWEHFPWDTVTVWVLTDTSVTSAELLINGTAYPLDAIGEWQYGRELVLWDVWTYDMGLWLYVNGEKTDFPQAWLEVVAKQWAGPINPTPTPTPVPAPTPEEDEEDDDITGIGTIKAVIDPTEKTTAHLSWTTIGGIDYFLVRYGQNPWFLDKQVIVIDTELSLEDLPSNSTMYVQVRPADSQWNAIGIPSDPVTLDVWSNAPPCIVRGIVVNTEKIDDRYYLTWEWVDNVSEYIVYRSDIAVNTTADMNEVGRTQMPSFPYPFDKYAENNEYAYYAVEAVCDDGSVVRVDSIKKVQVWPMTNIMLILLATLLAYLLWRLFALSKD